MPSINEVMARLELVYPTGYSDAAKAAWLLELDKRLLLEVVMRHRLTIGKPCGPVEVCPKCEHAEGLYYDRHRDYSSCELCGWTELPDVPHKYPEDGDVPLLVKAPYDNLYDLYLMAQTDFHRHETENYLNSMEMFNTALDEWKKAYHRTHEPLGVTYWRE